MIGPAESYLSPKLVLEKQPSHMDYHSESVVLGQTPFDLEPTRRMLTRDLFAIANLLVYLVLYGRGGLSVFDGTSHILCRIQS